MLPPVFPGAPWAASLLGSQDRAAYGLAAGGYSEKQVQAIFLKAADSTPTCDLNFLYQCGSGVPDAYTAETFMGNIMRYLKSGLSGTSRYANLQQVFLTTRIYGGYANGVDNSGNVHAECLNPEPFAYEEGFAVQRLITAQINSGQDPNGYSGAVDLSHAPWFDWGPYLWANGSAKSLSTGLFWCGVNSGGACAFGPSDVRYGDPGNLMLCWGDFTHPTDAGLKKVADALVTFLGNPWLAPWIKQ
jgi:hypothetical protein